jgi:hypothetical protein
LRDVGDPFISDDVDDGEILDILEGMRGSTTQAQSSTVGQP